MIAKKVILSICLLVLVSGCDSFLNLDKRYQFNGQSISVEELHSEIETLRENPKRRRAESHFHEINRKIPGFGGFYINSDSNYVMYLTNEAPRVSSRSIVAKQIMERKAQEIEKSSIIIKKGEYEFKKLAKWRELISAFLLSNDNFEYVLSSDLDESKNRVVVGIDEQRYNDGNITRVENFIREELEIPLDAVQFTKTAPAILSNEVTSSSPSWSGRLTSEGRPLIGGLNIVHQNQQSRGCTIGFTGVLNGNEVVVTNSHCTENIFSLASHLTFFQPFKETSNIIGIEYKDPNTTHCGLSYPFSNCRDSDAAAIKINGNVAIEQGKIARTKNKSDNQSSGSTYIDTNNPVFSIAVSARDNFLDVGDYVHKIGRKTGWTSGHITETCVDKRYVKNFWVLRCQYGADYYSDEGDSGSPVFRVINSSHTPPRASLLGINWGRESYSSTTRYFSPMSGIRSDLGNIAVDDPDIEYGDPGDDPDPLPPCEEEPCK